MNPTPIPYRGNYIDGVFRAPVAAEAELLSWDPHSSLVIGTVTESTQDVDAAVAAARVAQAAWQAESISARIQLVSAIAPCLKARQTELAETITREMGKPLWESKGEVQAAIAKIDVSISAGLELVREVRVGEDASYAFHPHGVLAVLGPFNFPLHLMHGHVVPALLLGNTVVLKPSEITPFVGQLYAEILAEAGLPPGVFNLVQGGPGVGAKLAQHPDVNGVLFTGSYRAGLAITRATIEQAGKLLALEMGGKNPALVLSDAPLQKALHDVAWGAFVTSGQRCSGTALCLVERGLMPSVQAELTRMLGGIRVGDPSGDVFMGPLAHESARKQLQSTLSLAESAGLELLGESSAPTGGAYAPATLHRVHQPDLNSAYLAEEVFGPDLALIEVEDLEAAVELANSLPYGLAASVFTRDNAKFEWARARLQYGCVNHNAPTCGASSKLPFGGVKQSGNHRPAALWSSLYCAYPVATLRGPSELTGSRSPGLDW